MNCCSHKGTPHSSVIIPDDINGTVTVSNNNNVVKYEFDNGKLLSVTVKWDSDNVSLENGLDKLVAINESQAP